MTKKKIVIALVLASLFLVLGNVFFKQNPGITLAAVAGSMFASILYDVIKDM